MTADRTRLPCQLLARMSTRITNEVPGVNRVVLDVTSKPSDTIKIAESTNHPTATRE